MTATGDSPAIHLVGVRGAGMCALARYLVEAGYRVSGSDNRPDDDLPDSSFTPRIPIAGHHAAENIPRDAALLIYSQAVDTQNTERVAARERNIPELSYAEALGGLMQERTGVCVAGTHGKTTTTAMLGWIVDASGLSPTVVHGGELLGDSPLGRSGQVGSGAVVVAESCEFQGSFLRHHPQSAAILSIESDHFDCYGSDAELTAAFGKFAALVPGDGYLLTADTDRCREAALQCAGVVETFGFTSDADWQASDVRIADGGSRFRVFAHGQYFAEVFLPIPGRYNVLNALAATALAARLGVAPRVVQEALREFPGLRRRFERVGSWKGVTLIDDYAHHPTEVAAALKTVRECYPHRRVLCAFQPHQVSRTLRLLPEFAQELCRADVVWVLPVFAAREGAEIDTETPSRRLVEATQGQIGKISYCRSLDRLLVAVDDETRPGDVLITMGAGDIGRIQHDLTRRLHRHHPPRRAAGPLYLAQARRTGTVLYHPAQPG